VSEIFGLFTPFALRKHQYMHVIPWTSLQHLCSGARLQAGRHFPFYSPTHSRLPFACTRSSPQPRQLESAQHATQTWYEEGCVRIVYERQLRYSGRNRYHSPTRNEDRPPCTTTGVRRQSTASSYCLSRERHFIAHAFISFHQVAFDMLQRCVRRLRLDSNRMAKRYYQRSSCRRIPSS